MQFLSNQVTAQLPDFMRPNTPFMKSVLTQQKQGTQRSRTFRLVRLVLMTVILLLMPFVGWYFALLFGNDPLATPNALDRAFIVLYWLMVLVQMGVRIVAFNMGAGSIASLMRAESWETLKATPDGATLAVKTYWGAVFYRIAPALFFLFIWRIYFVIVLLTNLTNYQGRTLDVFVGGTTPLGQPPFLSTDGRPTAVALILVILIMAITLTAGLLAPLTAAAFDAALGVWIGTLARGRVVSLVGQATLVLVRLVITGFSLWIGYTILTAGTTALLGQPLPPSLSWLGTLLSTSEGDLGLSLLHLPNYPQLWANIDYSILIGIAFLGIVLAEAVLANQLVKWSVRRASRADKV